ncbi:MAG: Holliday junction resolvase RuvX [Alphaproteobacteria bacterium]|nr:Holliday junction resolvase RuvX [Alphaproteobacteria bacterium]MBN2780025.1 Holliday junction resolvase RuvX [Alphaproteobacteria bacterium]
MPVSNRLIGIDYGERTIGLAVSDERLSIALPLKQFENKGTKAFISDLSKIIKDYHIGSFIWGMPYQLDGTRRPLCDKIEKIAIEISNHFQLPYHFIDERMTSKTIERDLIEADLSRKKRSNLLDKFAATQILQTALDQKIG